MEKEKRILVVDDDKAILESFKEILQLNGYIVDTAETGQEAIQKSEANFYDLVLLDIRLSDMEGTRLLKILHEGFPEMKKLMVTGYPSLENAIESLNQGANAYILKPVNPKKLLGTVEKTLRKNET